MGQAKNKKSHKKLMGFTERLQSDSADVVQDASYMVEQGIANWQIIEMPDGEKWIALCFKTTVFAIVDGKLTLKTGK